MLLFKQQSLLKVYWMHIFKINLQQQQIVKMMKKAPVVWDKYSYYDKYDDELIINTIIKFTIIKYIIIIII